MKTESEPLQKKSGMSARELQSRLFLDVTDRQFRRYVAAGVIPSAWVQKNANGHFTFHPPANTKWGHLRQSVQEWRGSRYRRGWERRPRVKKTRKQTGILTLEAIHVDFLRWKSRADATGFPNDWTPQQFATIYELLLPMHRTWSLAFEFLKRTEMATRPR
jgi:hypothetical protein